MDRWKQIGLGVLIVGTVLLWVALVREASSFHGTMAIGTFAIAAPVPSATPTPPGAGSSPPSSTDWPMIIFPFISTVLGGFGSGIFVLFLQKRWDNKEIENLNRENNELKRQNEDQQKLLNRYESPSMTPEDEQKYEGYAQKYVQIMHTNSEITRIKVLDASIETAAAYPDTKVTIPTNSMLPFRFSPAIVPAQEQRSVNAWLQAEQQMVEKLVAVAPEWHKAIEDLHHPKHFVLLGIPGSGKTTILKYLALKFKDHYLLDLPIYIDLAEFANSRYLRQSGHEIKDRLIAFAADAMTTRLQGSVEFHFKEAYKYLKKRANDGQVLFLLDALERTAIPLNSEQNPDINYQETVEIIHKMGIHYTKTPIIVTAHKAAFQHRASDAVTLTTFSKLELLDFGKIQMKLFLDKWPANTRKNAVTDLDVQLEQCIRMQALATTPFFLAQVAMLGSKLQEESITFYERYIEPLKRRWEIDNYTSSNGSITWDEKWLFLRKLAWYLHSEERFYFSKDDFENLNELRCVVDRGPDGRLLFGNRDVSKMIDELVIKHGLLTRVSDEHYCFSRFTLQEYCAAQYARRPNLLNELFKKRHDPWWEEVILLYAGITDPRPILRSLLEDIDASSATEQLFCESLLLAGRCLVTYIPLKARPKPIQQKVIKMLVDYLMATPYSSAQEKIAQTLVALAANEDIGFLEQKLKVHIDKSLHSHLEKAIRTPAKMPITLHLLLLLATNKNIHPDVCTEIEKTLDAPDTISIIRDLIALLSSQMIDVNTSMRIADIIGLQREPTLALTLLDQLKNGALDPEVRWSIAAAIGQIRNPPEEIIQHLETILADRTTDLHVRWSVMNARDTLSTEPLSTIAQLKKAFAEEQLNLEACQDILADLAAQSAEDVTTNLLKQLRALQLDCLVRKRIADALERLIKDRLLYEDNDPFLKKTYQELDPLLQNQDFSDVAENIYRTMWAISRYLKGNVL
jgi:hypothetical protein